MVLELYKDEESALREKKTVIRYLPIMEAVYRTHLAKRNFFSKAFKWENKFMAVVK